MLLCVCFFKAKCALYQTSTLNRREEQGGAFASLSKIRYLLHCAENLIRQSDTIGTGSCPERERKLTSAYHSWAQGRVQLCSDQAAISGARERMCRFINTLHMGDKRHFEGLLATLFCSGQ